MAQHYRELHVWQLAMDLVVHVYGATQSFPDSERFGLTNQLRRAAVSIPSNIAEGQGRGASQDFVHFLRIANGSRQEVETQIIIAERLEYLSSEESNLLMGQAQEVGKMISGLSKSVTSKLNQ